MLCVGCFAVSLTKFRQCIFDAGRRGFGYGYKYEFVFIGNYHRVVVAILRNLQLQEYTKCEFFGGQFEIQ